MNVRKRTKIAVIGIGNIGRSALETCIDASVSSYSNQRRTKQHLVSEMVQDFFILSFANDKIYTKNNLISC